MPVLWKAPDPPCTALLTLWPRPCRRRYHGRYNLLFQRLMRNPSFAPPVLGQSKAVHVTVTPIESVRSTEGSLCLFGMLTQPEEGKLCLEDLRDQVVLDVSGASVARGLFTETSIVLVQGYFRAEDEVFVVEVRGW